MRNGSPPTRRRRARPEADHELGQVMPFYGGLGVVCNKTSARVHAVGVTPGFPDLVCQWARWGFEFYHETKVAPERGGSRQTEAQRQFELRALECGTVYVLGDVESAERFAEWLGVARRLPGGGVEFLERHRWTRLLRMGALAGHGEMHLSGAVHGSRILAVCDWVRSDAYRIQRERFGYHPPKGREHLVLPPRLGPSGVIPT